MNEEELPGKLFEEVPEAGPYYWTRVDAALMKIEVLDDFAEGEPQERVEAIVAAEDIPFTRLTDEKAVTEIFSATPEQQEQLASRDPIAAAVPVEQPIDQGQHQAAGTPNPVVVDLNERRMSRTSKILAGSAAASIICAGTVFALGYDTWFGSSSKEESQLVATQSEEASTTTISNLEGESAADNFTPAGAMEDQDAAEMETASADEQRSVLPEEEESSSDTDDFEKSTTVEEEVTVPPSTTTEVKPKEEIEAEILNTGWATEWFDAGFDLVSVQEVMFEPGAVSLELSASLEPNTFSVLYLNASEGQDLSAFISSLQEDPYVQLSDESYRIVHEDFSSFFKTLDTSGRYYIILINSSASAETYQIGIEIL